MFEYKKISYHIYHNENEMINKKRTTITSSKLKAQRHINIVVTADLKVKKKYKKVSMQLSINKIEIMNQDC